MFTVQAERRGKANQLQNLWLCKFILNLDLTPEVQPEMKERLGKIFFACFESPFKTMVKETNYPERMADIRS